MAVYPYAMTSSCAVTLPLIDDTPTISRASDLLSGVKTTLNRVAVRFELSWHGLSDLDSMSRMAEASGDMERNMRYVRHEINRMLVGSS